jgi:hypothetical protein
MRVFGRGIFGFFVGLELKGFVKMKPAASANERPYKLITATPSVETDE